ncbi:MAG: hypothetical protein EZS28_025667, partial [Streblomastix strix]
MLGADTDEKKSVGSRMSTMSSSMGFMQYSRLEEILFTFIKGVKWVPGTLPDGIVIFLQIITAFQWFMMPLRNSRISTFGFHHVLMKLGIVVYILLRQVGQVQNDFQMLTLIMVLLELTIVQIPQYSISVKPLQCLLYKGVDQLPYNVQFCNLKLIWILQIFGPVIPLFGLILTFFLKVFAFDASMKNQSILVARKGLHEALILVIIGIWSSCCTLIVQKWDIVAGAIHTIIFLLLTFLVLLKLPRRRWRGNALLCSSLCAGMSGGINSLLLSGLEELGKKKLAVLGGILFYVLSICILIGMSILGWKVARWRCMNVWLIEGIYEQREINTIREELEQYIPNILNIQKGQRKEVFRGRGEESLTERSMIKEEINEIQEKQIKENNYLQEKDINNEKQVELNILRNIKKGKQTEHVIRKILVGIIVKTGPEWKEKVIFRLAGKRDIEEQQKTSGKQAQNKQTITPNAKNEKSSVDTTSYKSFRVTSVPPLLSDGNSPQLQAQYSLMKDIEEYAQQQTPLMSTSSELKPSLKRQMELLQYKDAPLILDSWPIIMKYFFKQWKYAEEIEKSLRFLEEDELARNEEILRLVGSVFSTMLKKNRFKFMPESIMDYALYLKDYRYLPMRMATLLQKMKEYFPSWTNKSISYQCSKQFEMNIGIRQGTSGGNQSGDSGQQQQQQISSVSIQSVNQLGECKKHYEIAKQHAQRMWSLLARRTIDVERVMFHGIKAMKVGQLAVDQYMIILKNNPKDSNALRQFALLERDVYLNNEGAIEMLKGADAMEEQIEQRTLGSQLDNDDEGMNEGAGEQEDEWVDPSDQLDGGQGGKKNAKGDENWNMNDDTSKKKGSSDDQSGNSLKQGV